MALPPVPASKAAGAVLTDVTSEAISGLEPAERLSVFREIAAVLWDVASPYADDVLRLAADGAERVAPGLPPVVSILARIAARLLRVAADRLE